jgi:acyl dehydratase
MIDRARLLAMEPIVAEQTLQKRDVILYALGVGAVELPFVYEHALMALPMMATVLGYPGFIWRDPAIGADWRRLLHAEQSLELHAPLPVEGQVRGETRFLEILDKGPEKGAVALVERRITDGAGTLLAIARATTFLRGDGGCGGPAQGAPAPHPVPDRAPDLTLAMPTAANQAMLYRLSGDDNPLHIDPHTAAAAGFPGPILHGLCTYAVAGRAVLAGLLDNQPGRLKRLDARFSAPVYPGETLEVRLWREGQGCAFQAFAAERGVKVLDHGHAAFA